MSSLELSRARTEQWMQTKRQQWKRDDVKSIASGPLCDHPKTPGQEARELIARMEKIEASFKRMGL